MIDLHGSETDGLVVYHPYVFTHASFQKDIL